MKDVIPGVKGEIKVENPAYPELIKTKMEAKKFTEVLKQKGIKQSFIAKAIGVQDAAVSQWKINGVPKDRVLEVKRILNIK